MAQDLPTPQSRSDKLLYSIAAGQTTDLPTPQSRSDEFMMAIITGDTSDLPTPQSRQEKYLKEIAYHSGGGGLKEVTTVEELESKLIKDNEGNVYHYSGETSGDYVKGNLYQVKTVNGYPYFVYYGYIPVYTINAMTENVTADPDNIPVIRPDGSVTLTFTADGEEWVVPYSAPAVTGADSVYIRVSDIEATITLTNPTADVEVEVVGVEPAVYGLYDENDQLIVTYEDSGMDVTIDWNSSTDAKADSRSGHSTMLRYPLTRKVILPIGVSRIGIRSFGSISNISSLSVMIPNSVISISDHAFNSCSGLTSITIPDGVTSIGYAAFAYCSKLGSISVSSSVTSIGVDAFYNCNVLNNIYITDISAWCNISGISSLMYTTQYSLRNRKLYLNDALLTDLVIPDGVAKVPDYAFCNCTSITSVTFEGKPTSIVSNAFTNASGIKDIYVPWAQGAVAGAPWGATNATIHYNWTPTN